MKHAASDQSVCNRGVCNTPLRTTLSRRIACTGLPLFDVSDDLLDGWSATHTRGLFPIGVADERGDDVGLGVDILDKARLRRVLSSCQGIVDGVEGEGLIGGTARRIARLDRRAALKVAVQDDLRHRLDVAADGDEWKDVRIRLRGGHGGDAGVDVVRIAPGLRWAGRARVLVKQGAFGGRRALVKADTSIICRGQILVDKGEIAATVDGMSPELPARHGIERPDLTG